MHERSARPLSLTRRNFMAGTAAIGASTFLAACTNSANDAPETPNGDGSAGDAFPVTLEDRYGSVTIPSAPLRIVSLGESDHDIIAKLGFTMVGVMTANWSMGGPVYPWNDGLFDPEGSEFIDVSDDFPYEEIAALTPDLIINQTGDVNADAYELLSAIAPTVAQTPGSEGWDVTWQDQAMMIGKALGKESEAAALIQEADDLFAQTREEHPEFAGKTAVAVQIYPPDYYVRGITDAEVTFLAGLGFEYAKQENGEEYTGFGTSIAEENLSLLGDVDLAIFDGEADMLADIQDSAVYSRTRLATEGRTLMTPARDTSDMLSAGLLLQNVVSLPWTIEHALPRILLAIDGDPSTDPNV